MVRKIAGQKQSSCRLQAMPLGGVPPQTRRAGAAPRREKKTAGRFGAAEASAGPGEVARGGGRGPAVCRMFIYPGHVRAARAATTRHTIDTS